MFPVTTGRRGHSVAPSSGARARPASRSWPDSPAPFTAEMRARK